MSAYVCVCVCVCRGRIASLCETIQSKQQPWQEDQLSWVRLFNTPNYQQLLLVWPLQASYGIQSAHGTLKTWARHWYWTRGLQRQWDRFHLWARESTSCQQLLKSPLPCTNKDNVQLRCLLKAWVVNMGFDISFLCNMNTGRAGVISACKSHLKMYEVNLL